MKILFCLILFFANSIYAQEKTSETLAAEAKEKIAASELTYEGVSLLQFASYQGASSPSERVELARNRLQFALSHVQTPAQLELKHFQFKTAKNYYEFYYDDKILFTMAEADMLASGLEYSDASAKQLNENLKKLFQESYTAHQPEKLALGVLYIVIVTFIFILVLRLFYKLALRGKNYVKNLIQKDHGKISVVFRFSIFKRADILRFLLTLIDALVVVISLVLFYVYIPVVFSFLPWTKGWADSIFEMVAEPIHWISQGLIRVLPGLFFIIVASFFARYLIKAVKLVFDAIEAERLKIEGFHRDWAKPTYQLVRIFIFVLLVVMCFPYIPGSSSPAFQGISVFLGILVSLGSSSAISNMIAGVVITYMRPFRVGERVKISETLGDITEKGLLVTRLRTIKNVEVTIPNSMILGSHIINYSTMAKQEGLILNTTLTLGYDIPWQKVHQLLEEAALSCKDILHDPKPFVLQNALNDFNISYELNAYTREANRMVNIYSDLHRAIHEVFDRAGVEILSPDVLSLRQDRTQ